MSEKKKKNTSGHMNRWLFVALWAAIHAITWGTLIGLYEAFNFVYGYDHVPVFILGGVLPGITLTIPQYWLIKRFKGIQIRWWRPASFAAWLIGATIFLFLRGSYLYPVGLLLSWFSVPFLVQAWLLRKHVRQSWLWVLAGVTSTVLFLFAGAQNDDSAIAWSLSGGLQGLLTGLIMLALFAMPQEEKQKHEIAHNNLSAEQLSDNMNSDYQIEDNIHSSSRQSLSS